MATDNPFSTPPSMLAEPSSEGTLANRQPFQFVAAMVAAAVLIFVGRNAWQWFSSLAGDRERLLHYLPMMLTNWAGGLLVNSAAVLVFVHYQRERYSIVRFQPMVGVLPAFAVLYLVCSLGVGVAVSAFSLPVYQWAIEHGGRVPWMGVYGQLTSLLSLALGCLLPLWLVLRVARPRVKHLAQGQDNSLAGWQVALGIALCFSALFYKLLASLSYGLLAMYSGDHIWQPVFALTSCVLPFAIVMAAVQTRLPQRVSRFAAGRVLAASVVLLAMWSAAILLVSLVVAFAAYSSLNSASMPLYLLPPAVLLVALLWPLARWCTGWFFAEQLARPSHG